MTMMMIRPQEQRQISEYQWRLQLLLEEVHLISNHFQTPQMELELCERKS